MRNERSLVLRKESIRVLNLRQSANLEGGDIGCLIVLSIVVSTATFVLCGNITDGPGAMCQPRPPKPHIPLEPLPTPELTPVLSQIGHLGTCVCP